MSNKTRVHQLKQLTKDWRVPHEWNRLSRETQTPGRERVGGRENKGNLEGRTNEYLEEETPVEIIEERKQRLHTSRMDTRLRTPVPRRRREGGWENKTTKDWTQDEEARVDLTRNAPDEKSWETTIGKPTAWSYRKIWMGRGVIKNTHVKIPYQSDEGAEE